VSRTIADDVQTSLRHSPHLYHQEYQRYRAIADHLAALDTTPELQAAIQEINQKLLHLNTRAFPPEQRLQRVSKLLNALIRGRYHRYSSGFLSFFKDVLLTWDR
jgi:hypothetical protein